MNKTLFLPLILLFFIIYFLLFPVGSGNEVYWKASNLYDLDRIAAADISLDKPLVVNQGHFRGVLNKGVGNSYMESGGGSRAYSETHLFRKTGNSFLIQNLENKGVMDVSLGGYPLVMGKHRYSLDFGSAYIREIDDSGQTLWRWQGVSPITAMTAGGGVTVFGSIDGFVRFFSSDGVMTELNMGNGKSDEIVYGLALSGDGNNLAVLSGLNEQAVRQFRLSDDNPPVLIYESTLEDRFREPVKLLYSRDGSHLWVEQKKNIIQFYNGRINQIIPLDGQFLTHAVDEEEGIYYTICRLNSSSMPEYQLTSYTYDGLILMKNSFEKYPEYFNISGSQIFLSIDDKMAVLTRKES